jgi:periplasmic divalent cation tolerance protein
MPTNTLIVFCTCPTREKGEHIANSLVSEGLAACVNITSPITSVYTWEGKCQSEEEVLLLIKTTRQRYPNLEQAIGALHPYELPEIIAVPVEQGLPGYLDWVAQCTKTST